MILASLSKRVGGKLFDWFLFAIYYFFFFVVLVMYVGFEVNAIQQAGAEDYVAITDYCLPAFLFSCFYIFPPFIYQVLGHYYWGKTFGKAIAGTKVVNLAGKRITFYESLKRVFFDFLIVALPMAVPVYLFFYGVDFNVPDLQSINSDDMFIHWLKNNPLLFGGGYILVLIFGLFANLWFYGDPVAMFVTEKKQSLHDLVAKTIVIDERKTLEAKKK